MTSRLPLFESPRVRLCTDAYLAVADGVVTSSGKEAEMREREQAWRLAFDCWRRAQQQQEEGWQDEGLREGREQQKPPRQRQPGRRGIQQTSRAAVRHSLLTVPSAPSRLLSGGDFAAFCRHCVTSSGRNAVARGVLAPYLDAALAAPYPRRLTQISDWPNALLQAALLLAARSLLGIALSSMTRPLFEPSHEKRGACRLGGVCATWRGDAARSGAARASAARIPKTP